MTIVRPITHSDLDALRTVAHETGLFPPDMVVDFTADTLSSTEGAPLWLVAEYQSAVCGLCYAAPEMLTESVWNMLALGVRPANQRDGLGGALVAQLEADLRDAGARMLIVDTSSTDDFLGARNFYAGNGYHEEARIRDYWDVGDDKVTFRKVL
ncbi:MAG: GNAT family N-acetyltransferase [Pseudomonadota bacterium]